MDYTAVGDAVNLAARFEQYAGPSQVLVTAILSPEGQGIPQPA
jgi:class 3 adenylate cyclase